MMSFRKMSHRISLRLRTTVSCRFKAVAYGLHQNTCYLH